MEGLRPEGLSSSPKVLAQMMTSLNIPVLHIDCALICRVCIQAINSTMTPTSLFWILLEHDVMICDGNIFPGPTDKRSFAFVQISDAESYNALAQLSGKTIPQLSGEGQLVVEDLVVCSNSVPYFRSQKVQLP